jgi:hypothetical protein
MEKHPANSVHRGQGVVGQLPGARSRSSSYTSGRSSSVAWASPRSMAFKMRVTSLMPILHEKIVQRSSVARLVSPKRIVQRLLWQGGLCTPTVVRREEMVCTAHPTQQSAGSGAVFSHRRVEISSPGTTGVRPQAARQRRPFVMERATHGGGCKGTSGLVSVAQSVGRRGHPTEQGAQPQPDLGTRERKNSPAPRQPGGIFPDGPTHDRPGRLGPPGKISAGISIFA